MCSSKLGFTVFLHWDLFLEFLGWLVRPVLQPVRLVRVEPAPLFLSCPPSIEVFNEDWVVFPGDTFVNFSKFVGHSSPIIAFFLWLYLLGPAESTLLDSSTQVYAWKRIFINLHCRNNPIVLHLWLIVFVYTKNIAILSSMREGIIKFTISTPFQLIHWWNCVRKFNLPKPC